MTQRVMDWVAGMHDPRSLAYDIRSVVPRGSVKPRPRFWDPGPVIDQGSEGECVGFAWTNDLTAAPRPDPHVTGDAARRFARAVYAACKRIDGIPGVDGTYVNAGAKVVRGLGFIDGWRWAFNVEALRDAVIAEGPAIIGIPWLSGMYGTRPSGLVDVTGNVVGGHAILVTGYHPRMRIRGEGWFRRHEVFAWHNSWGPGYGQAGRGLIRADDLAGLVAQHGEMCIPTGRSLVRIT